MLLGLEIGKRVADRRPGVLHAKCFYYFFMAIVVITDEAKATARRALMFIVRIFVDDTIAITVWASFCFHAPRFL
jgi:hypothetical protein